MGRLLQMVLLRAEHARAKPRRRGEDKKVRILCRPTNKDMPCK